MKAATWQLNLGLVIDGSDHFILPIEAELRQRYHVDRFVPRFVRVPLIGTRVNELLLNKQLQRLIKQHDVVFFEWAASLLIRASQWPKLGRMVTRLHSVELATAADQIDWSKVDRVIVLNQAIRQRLQVLVHGPLPPLAVIANGIDLTRYQSSPRPFRHKLGMVCNLLPIKRVYEMILCLHQLRQEGYPFALQVAGKPANEERRYAWALENLVKRLHLSEFMTFCGYVGNIVSWLKNIDVFISNSYWEGQQVALIEAMASGCYCLSHCWDGAQEMLPPENIYITDCDLRAKLLAYAALPEAEKQQAQARMHAIAEEKFDERRMVSQIVELIEQVARE